MTPICINKNLVHLVVFNADISSRSSLWKLIAAPLTQQLEFFLISSSQICWFPTLSEQAHISIAAL